MLKEEIDKSKTPIKEKEEDIKIKIVKDGDVDPVETKEWIESLSAVLEKDGKHRAQFLINNN